jgi:hypothetical protein
VKESENDLSDFARGQIVGARLPAALLGVSRAYMNHGKTTVANRNSKRISAVPERDRRTLRRIVSKNHIITAAQVNCSKTEYVFILKPLFPQKLSDVSFKNPISTVGL